MKKKKRKGTLRFFASELVLIPHPNPQTTKHNLFQIPVRENATRKREQREKNVLSFLFRRRRRVFSPFLQHAGRERKKDDGGDDNDDDDDEK